MSLTIQNLKNAYDDAISKNNTPPFQLGKRFGYMEAILQSFDKLETELIDGVTSVKLKTVKSNKWWKSDTKETYQAAIIRMTEGLLIENNIEIKK